MTITWTDDDPLDASAFQILLDGQSAATTFTHSPSLGQITSSGTVPLLAGGTRTLTASFCDIWSNCSTESVTYYAPAAVGVVRTDSDTLRVAGSSTHAVRFRVVNPGTARTLYTLTPSCTNTGSCALPAGVATVTVEGGDSAYVDVAFQAPASGSAVVRLTASFGVSSSQGARQVIALAAPSPGFPGDSASLLRSERSACVTLSLGPGRRTSAATCGWCTGCRGSAS